MRTLLEKSNQKNGHGPFVYWRVEGTLLELTTVRPIAFFTTNAQSFLGRMLRRGVVLVMAVLRPLLYLLNRVFAARVVHAVLRGVSRDRLDLLGEEFFKYKWEPHLDKELVGRLKSLVESGANVVLVSHSLDHQVRPLAQYMGVKWIVANRLEFRDGFATGRLLEPVIRPKRIFERLFGRTPKVSRDPELLIQDLGLRDGVTGEQRRRDRKQRHDREDDAARHDGRIAPHEAPHLRGARAAVCGKRRFCIVLWSTLIPNISRLLSRFGGRWPGSTSCW